MYKKLILFDCDGTLWSAKKGDYISKVPSSFKRVGGGMILREKDGETYKLRLGVLKAFDLLAQSESLAIGIVSDNVETPVIETLKLFNLWQNITPEAVNVSLWNGYCPKEEMVLDILRKKRLRTIKKENVYWFDDKNYALQAKKIGVNFSLVSDISDLYEVVVASVG